MASFFMVMVIFLLFLVVGDSLKEQRNAIQLLDLTAFGFCFYFFNINQRFFFPSQLCENANRVILSKSPNLTGVQFLLCKRGIHYMIPKVPSCFLVKLIQMLLTD